MRASGESYVCWLCSNGSLMLGLRKRRVWVQNLSRPWSCSHLATSPLTHHKCGSIEPTDSCDDGVSFLFIWGENRDTDCDSCACMESCVIWVFAPFIYFCFSQAWRPKHIMIIFCCPMNCNFIPFFWIFQALSLVKSQDDYEGVTQDLTAQLILIKNKPKLFLMLEIHTESWDRGCGQFPSCAPLVRVQGSVQVVSCPRVICSGLF